jgi:uncharacterized protein (TIGR03437 family)
VCPSLDVTVENGSTLPVAAGSACQIAPTLVNTGEAQWLPASASRGVVLRTSAGEVPLPASLPSLERTTMGPLAVTMGSSTLALTGRLRVSGVGDFGEVVNLTLTPDPTVSGSCPVSLSPTGAVSVPSTGATGTIQIATPSGCNWAASSPQSWITFSPPVGLGSAVVTYTVEANYGPKRQTAINIGNYSFTVTEDGVSNSALADGPTISAASLSFGERTVGASGASRSVQVTNSGAVPLSISAVTIGGLNSGDFTETDNCATTLAAGSPCTIQVGFSPTATGIRTASLFIAGNIPEGTSAVVLSGTGVASGPVPVIQAIADSWGYTAGIAPGLWVTIGGTNLAGPPRTWNLGGDQFLPVLLGGVTVTFNGLPAALMYVSPTQINALVPAGVAPGNVQVVVQVDGVNSAPFTISATSAQPAVYALPTPDGKAFYVTAALAGTATLVGNSAADPRVVRSVYPGDTLDLYMIGLGSTQDPSGFITDRIFSGAYPVSAPVTATVGGESANVLFAGLTSPGLYLVRIVVPSDLAAGSQPLQVSVGGIPTRSSLMLQMGTPPSH